MIDAYMDYTLVDDISIHRYKEFIDDKRLMDR